MQRLKKKQKQTYGVQDETDIVLIPFKCKYSMTVHESFVSDSRNKRTNQKKDS